MAQNEIAALIPANVVETLCEGLSYWDRQAVRASLAAGLAAWGGMEHFRNTKNGSVYLETLVTGGTAVIILPIEEPTP